MSAGGFPWLVVLTGPSVVEVVLEGSVELGLDQ